MKHIIIITLLVTAAIFSMYGPAGQVSAEENGSVNATEQHDAPEGAHTGQPATSADGDITIETEVDNSLLYPGEEVHLANMRQLTFEGENAEAYFSADGTKLILQRHVEEGGCDQIYIMDIESGEMELVSTGDGACTCSYFHYPDDDMILYASTHLYGEECPPRADMSLGYVWTLHDEFEVFTALPDGSNLTRLTDSWGYDAECAFAHDGTSIVWCSDAGGDLEIWTMDPDGSNKVQLTDTLGYDGGPFFSWDSSMICWRGYYPETEQEINSYLGGLEVNGIRPMPLQIMIMNRDGSNKQQLTDNGAANFCPFFMPNDVGVIYTTNYNAVYPMDFNLWIVDINGENHEQVSFYDGFDAFPMFSPDGKKLAFASNRNAATPGDTNIFICDWID